MFYGTLIGVLYLNSVSLIQVPLTSTLLHNKTLVTSIIILIGVTVMALSTAFTAYTAHVTRRKYMSLSKEVTMIYLKIFFTSMCIPFAVLSFVIAPIKYFALIDMERVKYLDLIVTVALGVVALIASVVIQQWMKWSDVKKLQSASPPPDIDRLYRSMKIVNIVNVVAVALLCLSVASLVVIEVYTRQSKQNL